jgi:hypothetical protein
MGSPGNQNPPWFFKVRMAIMEAWQIIEYMKGSIIPELIINQQGFSSQEKSEELILKNKDPVEKGRC